MKNTNEKLPVLTKGEESVMQILWSLGDGLVYDMKLLFLCELL